MMDLMRMIVDSGNARFGLPPGKSPGEVPRREMLADKGMPVGNLSSQMFANIYLNELDQYCKRELKTRYYVRYGDDIIILHADKKQLGAWKALIRAFLAERLKLDLNNKTCIRPATLGMEFCGYKIWPTHIKLRKATALKMRRHLRYIMRQYAAGKMPLSRAMQTVNSYIGMLSHCDSYALRSKIFGDSETGEAGWFYLRRDAAQEEEREK